MTSYQLNDKHLLRYREHLQLEERSNGTIDKYLRDVRQFAAWLRDALVDRSKVAAWKAALLAQHLAPTTINSKLAALNGLFRVLGWHDCHTSYIKVQRRMFRDAGRELSRSDYEKLVQTARSQGRRRLTLILETICASGIRVSELRYITVEAARRGKAEIMLKGKVRVILLTEKPCRKLLHYAAKEKIACGEIFLTADGTCLSRQQIWAEMKALAKSAGVDAAKVFPHNLRHLFATIYYSAYRDIVRLADVLGHSSVETTRIYLLTSGTEHLQQLERLRLVL
ncbi:MAG: tyrosine-type recombinase/integrase [Peptococcaceae bacterium]|nr:tyrosine-type recombinase/integrase [Peptococcaceae bacterium]